LTKKNEKQEGGDKADLHRKKNWNNSVKKRRERGYQPGKIAVVVRTRVWGGPGGWEGADEQSSGQAEVDHLESPHYPIKSKTLLGCTPRTNVD